MFEKVGRVAEQVATNVSRRQFVGRLGQGALLLAGVVGGFLAFPGESAAGARGCRPGTCFCYYRPNGQPVCHRYCCPRR